MSKFGNNNSGFFSGGGIAGGGVPVIGGGTVNYVSKFVAAHEVGDSTIFDNGTGVMIGSTTYAGYKLDVVGADSRFNTVRVGLGGGSVSSNTVVGRGALGNNTTGSANVALGVNSLFTNIDGANVTSLGFSALMNNTSGSENTAVGHFASYTNTTGGANTAIGKGALFFNSSSDFNTAVGHECLLNTTGGFNTAIGYHAGYNNTSGALNIFIGFNAGALMSTGNYNTIIGTGVTGLASNLSNTVIISDGAGNVRFYSPASNNVLIGTLTDVASSIFTIDSTSQGFLPPRMTTAQKNAIPSPAKGLIIFDLSLNKLCVYTTAWETVTSV